MGAALGKLLRGIQSINILGAIPPVSGEVSGWNLEATEDFQAFSDGQNPVGNDFGDSASLDWVALVNNPYGGSLMVKDSGGDKYLSTPGSSTQGACCISGGILAAGDLKVVLTIQVITAIGGMWFCSSIDWDTLNRYRFNWRPNGKELYIDRGNKSGGTTIAEVDANPGVGDTLTFIIRANGDLQYYLNDSLEIDINDTTYSGPWYIGGNFQNSGIGVDDMKIYRWVA